MSVMNIVPGTTRLGWIGTGVMGVASGAFILAMVWGGK